MLTNEDHRTRCDALGPVLAALADPTRRAIVRRLARSDANVAELAEPFSVSLPAISRHLKVLEVAGLISRGRNGRERPCRLRPDALRSVSVWADLTREAWEERLDRLDGFLGDEASAAGPTTDDRRPTTECPTTTMHQLRQGAVTDA